MRGSIAVIYNQPQPCRYYQAGEEAAVTGVLDAADAVSTALQELGYDVQRIPLTPPIEEAEKQLGKINADIVFNLFEGFGGQPRTEADLADMLAATGVPFTGCPAIALRQALDKAGTNTILRDKGITTPASQLLDGRNLADFRLNFPCIIKPPAEDASHGLSEKSVVYDMASLRRQLDDFSRDYGGQALVEEFIAGWEFNVTVMGGGDDCAALPITEIAYTLPSGKPNILTYAAKWQPESLYYKNTRVICPAKITPQLWKQIERMAAAAFKLLDCRGYARVDMRMDGEGRLYVIEINPNPDISPSAGAACQAKAAGMTYIQFIQRIVKLTWEQR